MSTRPRILTAALALVASFSFALALAIGGFRLDDASARPDDPARVAVAPDTHSTERAAAGSFRISGPFAHENLTVFLVHGAARGTGEMLTLEEAMSASKLVVYETGNVNELEVENVGDTEIFIQASEIVKGGQQDRALAVDMIVPPKSGRVPIAAFCVEQGRWSQRGGEDVAAFNSAKGALNSKELRMAARYEADQSKVWRAVAKAQDKLAGAIGGSVADERSSSSLQLTLEHQDVGRLADAYVAALKGHVEGKDDVIGYAFAINGAINSAEVYGSPALFRKLWPKMLRTAAVEAVGERADSTRGVATIADVEAVLAEAEGGASGRVTKAGAARSVAFESGGAHLFETRDESGSGETWVHRSYVTK